METAGSPRSSCGADKVDADAPTATSQSQSHTAPCLAKRRRDGAPAASSCILVAATQLHRTAENNPNLLPFNSEELDGGGVRARCIAPGTIGRYKSYLNGIRKWVMANKNIVNPQRFFNAGGELNPATFTPKDFEAFLLAKRKDLKAVTLGGYRSAMKDLYRRNNIPVPAEYGDSMKTLFSGIKRLQADNDQTADVRSSGKQALTYSRYEKLCSSTLARNDGGFTHLFLTTQWNLMCRSKSVETIRTSHLVSADDSIGCVLHKTKTNQEGSGPKDPRHMYANPLAPATCWVTALAVYFASNPRLKPGARFPGSNQKLRFGKALGDALKGDQDARLFGTHSIRKGVASFACSGSIGGPSIVSVCLRCGWSLGGVQDRYFRYESAGDQFLGRVVAGLPLNSAEFGVLPPHFSTPTNATISEYLARMFPVLIDDNCLHPLLLLCMASLAYHSDYLLHVLPHSHTLRSTYLFRNPTAMTWLRQQITTRDSQWMRPTGIPPYVEIYKQLDETKAAVKGLPEILFNGFSQMLDEKAVSAGNITREVLKQTIKELLVEAGIGGTTVEQTVVSESAIHAHNIHFWGNKFHFLPENFEFPSTDPHTAWKLWWFGNSAHGYPPLRQITSRNLSSRQKANTLSDWSALMKRLVVEIEAARGISANQNKKPKNSSQLEWKDLHSYRQLELAVKLN